MSVQFGTWHYGTNGPPYNGFGRIARWQCDKVIFFCQSLNSSQASLSVFQYEPLTFWPMTNDHVGAWASTIWWHWGHFLTLRQWLHILHVAGSFISTITEFAINSHITHYLIQWIIFTSANEMYQAVIHFHTFSINSASPTESSWEKKSCIWT